MVLTSLVHDSRMLDAGTHRGGTVSAGVPGSQQAAKPPTHFCQVRERLLDVPQLQTDEIQIKRISPHHTWTSSPEK
jgi:hypothetical protein